MEKRVYAVIGASRGIGLEFVSQLVSNGHHVIATARDPEKNAALQELLKSSGDRLSVHALDCTNGESVKKFAKAIEGHGIDVLINNAGVNAEGGSKLREQDFAQVLAVLNTNAVGPMRITAALLPNLKKSKGAKLINISSKMGSFADNFSGGSYSYRMSKVALNMFNKSFMFEEPDVISVVVHPGWVKTDMGGSAAPLTPAKSVDGMLKLIDGLKLQDSGRFYEYSGKEIAW